MSTKRLILLADDLDLLVVCQALIATGVPPGRVYISQDCAQEVVDLPEVVADLPVGRLVLHGERGMCRYCRPNSCTFGCCPPGTLNNCGVP